MYIGSVFYIATLFVAVLFSQRVNLALGIIFFIVAILNYFFKFFRYCTIVSIFISVGLLRMYIFHQFEFDHSLDNVVGNKATYVFFIQNLPHTSGNKNQMTLKNETGSNVLFETSSYGHFFYGDRIEVEGQIKKINQNSYLKNKIFYKISSNKTKIIKQNTGNKFVYTLYFLRSSFFNKIKDIFPSPHGELVAGLTVEGSDAISKDFKEKFRKTGLSHIVALSGTNVAILIEAVTVVCKKLRREIRFGIMYLFIIGFALMTGLSSTVMRASLMATISVSGDVMRRKYNALRGLFIALLVMSLWNPYTPIYDISFQLSFIATLSMLTIVPVLNLLLVRIISHETLRETLSTTLSAEILVSPLILYYSGNFSIIAPVANVLVVPFIPFAMLLGALPVLFSFSNMLARVVSLPGYFLVSYIFFIVEFCSGLSFASTTIHIPLTILVGVYSVIILLVCFSHKVLSVKLNV